MKYKKHTVWLALVFTWILTACSTEPLPPEISASNDEYESMVSGGEYETVEGQQIKLITENTEVIVTLNDSQAAASLVSMLPVEMKLIERNRFAKGMTLPQALATQEATTREYQIGDFGYWSAGPDLAIFYDDIYEQTVVEIIPLGHAESGAEALADETGTVRLELAEEP